MVVDKISEYMSELSINTILKGDPSLLLPVFYLVISIALYSIIIWHFYRFISRRDCFIIKYSKHQKLFSLLKYSLIYPFVAFFFFTGFALMLLFITRKIDLYGILTTSFAIVTAIRITAYYNEDLSKDLAKMLPFALLGLFLVEPAYFSFIEILDKISLLPEFFTLCIQFIILVVFEEWILRSIRIIKKTIITKTTYKNDQNLNPTIQ